MPKHRLFFVARKELRDRLVYDSSWCWRLNGAGRYIEASQTIAAGNVDAAAHLYMAVIDKYCGRAAVLRDDRARAQARLEPGQFDQLKRDVEGLQIGAEPNH